MFWVALTTAVVYDVVVEFAGDEARQVESPGCASTRILPDSTTPPRPVRSGPLRLNVTCVIGVSGTLRKFTEICVWQKPVGSVFGSQAGLTCGVAVTPVTRNEMPGAS